VILFFYGIRKIVLRNGQKKPGFMPGELNREVLRLKRRKGTKKVLGGFIRLRGGDNQKYFEMLAMQKLHN